MNGRAAELAANLAEAHGRIERACEAAGRNPQEITLITVTKTWPLSDIRHLIDLGVREFGESREQEGREKCEALADNDLVWHFIGRIQRNKAARIGQWAHVVHSVDRHGLLGPLAGSGRNLRVLAQISLDGDTSRGGVPKEHLLDLARAIDASPSLEFSGVMAVAPLHGDPDVAFALLADIHDRLLASYPAARWRSAGMSGDLEAAIAHGATHVRLGTSILGTR